MSLAGDIYWHLPVEDAFDLTSEPSTFTVGQVSDDLDEVVHDEPGGIPEAAWHNLSHLIGVLRAVEFTARSRRPLFGAVSPGQRNTSWIRGGCDAAGLSEVVGS